MLKYIAWRNLLSISILSGHTRGVQLAAKDRRWGLSATSRAGSEPLNNLNENKIILTSNCW
jgi:hypothetical protein